MKYEVEYGGTEEQKLENALKDCKNFLSGSFFKEGAFEYIMEVIDKGDDTNLSDEEIVDKFAFAISFAGIQGYYPVLALIKESRRLRSENKNVDRL